MIHRLKTHNNKLLVELRTTDYGSEFYTTNEVKILKGKIHEANSEHGLEFESDMSSLNKIHDNTKKLGEFNLIDEVTKDRFTHLCEKWALKYSNED